MHALKINISNLSEKNRAQKKSRTRAKNSDAGNIDWKAIVKCLAWNSERKSEREKWKTNQQYRSNKKSLGKIITIINDWCNLNAHQNEPTQSDPYYVPCRLI